VLVSSFHECSVRETDHRWLPVRSNAFLIPPFDTSFYSACSHDTCISTHRCSVDIPLPRLPVSCSLLLLILTKKYESRRIMHRSHFTPLDRLTSHVVVYYNTYIFYFSLACPQLQFDDVSIPT